MPGTKLADAYVQVIPSAEGIQGKLMDLFGADSVKAGESAGKMTGLAMAKKLVAAFAALKVGEKIVDGIKSSVTAGGALQQSIGGIESMYATASQRVIQYANNAYKSAGLSANDYMQKVTRFSASLITSLGGDTMKASEVANSAVVAMSDNVNRFGTDMETVANVYQNLSKQQFQTLDNLNLGYAGTKEGMQELIKHANELKVANGEMGTLSINSFADMIEAIQLVQDELHITGTTAAEAKDTLEGSANMMKSAWQNLLGNLALGDKGTESLKTSMHHLASSAATFLFKNLIPMVGNVIKQLPGALSTFFQEAWPYLRNYGSEMLRNLIDGFTGGSGDVIGTVSGLLDKVISWLEVDLPKLAEAGMNALQNWIDGWGKGDGELASKLGELVGKICKILLDLSIELTVYGTEMVIRLLVGFVKAIPDFLRQIRTFLSSAFNAMYQKIPSFSEIGQFLVQKLRDGLVAMLGYGIAGMHIIINGIKNAVTNFFPTMLSLGRTLITNIVNGIKAMVSLAVNTVRSLVTNAKSVFTNTNWASVGREIINGIINGISNAASSLFRSLQNLASDALDKAKSVLGINSPSKVFRDEVGKWIPEGLAIGIEANSNSVTRAMDELTKDTLQIGTSMVVNSARLHNFDANASTSDTNDRMAAIESMLVKYLPLCAQGLAVDGERMADKIESRIAESNRKVLTAW